MGRGVLGCGRGKEKCGGVGGGVGKCVGVWGPNTFPPTLPDISPYLPSLPNTFPYTYPHISPHLPLHPTTLSHTSLLTSSHLPPHLFLHLPLLSTHFPTPFPTSPLTSQSIAKLPYDKLSVAKLPYGKVSGLPEMPAGTIFD